MLLLLCNVMNDLVCLCFNALICLSIWHQLLSTTAGLQHLLNPTAEVSQHASCCCDFSSLHNIKHGVLDNGCILSLLFSWHTALQRYADKRQCMHSLTVYWRGAAPHTQKHQHLAVILLSCQKSLMLLWLCRYQSVRRQTAAVTCFCLQ